jgi:hypothetical protein
MRSKDRDDEAAKRPSGRTESKRGDAGAGLKQLILQIPLEIQLSRNVLMPVSQAVGELTSTYSLEPIASLTAAGSESRRRAQRANPQEGAEYASPGSSA